MPEQKQRGGAFDDAGDPVWQARRSLRVDAHRHRMVALLAVTLLFGLIAGVLLGRL